MVQYDPRLRLPSSAELPDSDDTPVDNELQNLVPNLLDQTLGLIWQRRDDWFFGVDMGIYADTKQPCTKGRSCRVASETAQGSGS